MGAFTSKPQPPAKAKAVVTAVDRTVLDLKNSRDRLHRYRHKLAIDDARLLEQAARAKKAGCTATALGVLRLRQFKLRQAEACEAQLLTVLQMVETIGSTQNDAVLLAAMAAGKDALRQMHEATTVDDVLSLLEQIQEQHEVEDEISGLLQDALPALSVADEQAVVDELDALTATVAAAASDAVGANAAEANGTDAQDDHLPEAPTHKLPEVRVPTAATAGTKQQTAAEQRVAVAG